MNLYSIALFVHVVGALLLFVTLTVEGVALRLLHRAATPEASCPTCCGPAATPGSQAAWTSI